MDDQQLHLILLIMLLAMHCNHVSKSLGFDVLLFNFKCREPAIPCLSSFLAVCDNIRMDKCAYLYQSKSRIWWETFVWVTRCLNLKYCKVQMESLPRSLDYYWYEMYSYNICVIIEYLLWPMIENILLDGVIDRKSCDLSSCEIFFLPKEIP